MFFKKSKNPEKICRFCVHAKLLDDGEHVLCNKRGVVKENYVCKKFVYDFLKREPSRARALDAVEFVDIND